MTRGSQKFTSFFFLNFSFCLPHTLFPLSSIHPSFLPSLTRHTLHDRSTVKHRHKLLQFIHRNQNSGQENGKRKKTVIWSHLLFLCFFSSLFCNDNDIISMNNAFSCLPPPPFFLTAMSFFMPLQKHNVLPPSPHFPLLQECYSLRCSWTFLCYILTSGSEYW